MLNISTYIPAYISTNNEYFYCEYFYCVTINTCAVRITILISGDNYSHNQGRELLQTGFWEEGQVP